MDLSVKIGDVFQSLKHALLIPLDLFLFHFVKVIENCGEQSGVGLANGFVHERPTVAVPNFAVAPRAEQKVDTLQVFIILNSQFASKQDRCVALTVLLVQHFLWQAFLG